MEAEIRVSDPGMGRAIGDGVQKVKAKIRVEKPGVGEAIGVGSKRGAGEARSLEYEAEVGTEENMITGEMLKIRAHHEDLAQI